MSKALTGQIEDKLRKSCEAEANKREKEMDKEYNRKSTAERQSAEKKAKESFTDELADMRQQISKKDKVIKEAHRYERNLRQPQLGFLDEGG